MKLCPQCEFIYEDDQLLCDMDGKELVLEPTLTASSTKPELDHSGPLTRARSLRSGIIAVSFLAALLLASILFVCYYAFTQGVAPATRKPPSAKTADSRAPNFNPGPRGTQEGASPAALATPGASRSPQMKGEPAKADAEFQTGDSNANGARPTDERVLSPALAPATGSASASGGYKATNQHAASAKTSAPLSVHNLPTVKPLPQVKPLPKLAAPPAVKKAGNVTVPAPGTVKPKKETRVGSFLKKTARIITKPFKS